MVPESWVQGIGGNREGYMGVELWGDRGLGSKEVGGLWEGKIGL